MTEKLIISNFACLRNVSLELRPVTLLIGQQATGKSIIAKLLFFFRLVGYRVLPASEERASSEEFIKETRKLFCRYFPPVNWKGSPFSLTYHTGEEQIEVTYAGGDISEDNGGFVVRVSSAYLSVLAEASAKRTELASQITEEDAETRKDEWRKARQQFEGQLAQSLGSWANFQQVFIPAARAFFTQVQKSVFTSLAEGSQFDPFLINFGKILEESQNLLEQRGYFSEGEDHAKRWQVFHSASAKILTAKWIREEKEDYLLSDDGRKVRLAQASSGQQEALPLLLLLGRFWGLPHRHGRAVYIEEPEAHLFPSTQRALIRLIVRVFRKRAYQMRLVVTTHSPYVLTAFNNLLHAGVLYASADEQEKQRLKKIIAEDWCLKPTDLIAYVLEDGEARSIMDSETKLVDATIIDTVSTDMAKEFDRLLWEGK